VNISASGQANAKATITNTDTASYSHLDLSSSSAQNSSLYQFGSTFTTSGRYIQGSTVLEAGGAGGLNLATSAATPLRFYTNGDNLRGSISSAGIWNITNTTAGSAGAGALVVSGGLATGAASYFGAQTSFGPAFTPLAWGTNSIDVNGAGGGLIAAYYAGTAKGYMIGNSADLAINTQGAVPLLLRTNSATRLTIDGTTGAATFAGAVAIGNTVNTVSPTSPNRTVTMVIGGVTYYLAAKTTND
jgi:hypothetical protein